MAERQHVILASGSHTRHEMLKAAGLAFTVVPADIDEEAIRKALALENEAIDPADVAELLARAKGEADRGIFCCGSGAGMSITANRVQGVRAVVCPTTDIARLARAHNDANVLCLAARFIENEPAWQVTHVFLTEPFEGGRHLRRVEKIEKSTSCD